MSTRTIFFAIAISIAFAGSPVLAGCIGAAVGDGCIGVPTPHDDRDWERDRAHDLDHHHHDTVIIRKHHHDDDDD